MLDLYSKQLLMKKSKSSSPITGKFGDRIDNKATVVGTFESSDLGTVVFAVLDAQYRGVSIDWISDVTTNVKMLQYFAAEDALNAKESATYMTNYIINNNTTISLGVISYCRSINPLKFNNKTYQCQLPNVYELQYIFNNKEALDSYDITIKDNSSKKLSEGGLYNQIVWLPTAYSYITNLVFNMKEGKFNLEYFNAKGAVLPIIEIPLSDFGY